MYGIAACKNNHLRVSDIYIYHVKRAAADTPVQWFNGFPRQHAVIICMVSIKKEIRILSSYFTGICNYKKVIKRYSEMA